MIEEYRPLTIICGTDSFCPIFREFLHTDLSDFIYLSPTRGKAERVLQVKKRNLPSWFVPTHVGWSGEFLLDILFDQAGVVEQTNVALKQMKIPYVVKIDSTEYEEDNPDDIRAIVLAVDSTAGGNYHNYADAGFGFQQLLPVIVQCLLPEHKTLLIEHPEIQLHPVHQVELGDLFIRSALGEQKNTVLVKTHSEHLILRIMRRMRETHTGTLPEGALAVRSEDVAVLLVEPNGMVREMPLNARGELVKAWPGGFFEEALREALGGTT